MKLSGVLFASCMCLLPFQGALANQATPAPAMDCSTANTMMMGTSAMPMSPPSPSMAAMSMDKMFVMQMHDMTMHGMQMAKMEAACGKDEKTRAMAAKMTMDLQDYATRLQMMLESQPG